MHQIMAWAHWHGAEKDVVGDLNQSGGVTKLRVKKENYAYPR